MEGEVSFTVRLTVLDTSKWVRLGWVWIKVGRFK